MATLGGLTWPATGMIELFGPGKASFENIVSIVEDLARIRSVFLHRAESNLGWMDFELYCQGAGEMTS